MNIKLILIAFILTSYAGITNCSAQNNTNSSTQIKNLIAKKRSYNKTYGFGYRIQLYNGTEKKARSYQERFKIEFPGIYSKLTYNTPEWKVQVGNYKTRLEADKALIKFKKEFIGIIVIPMGK